MREARPRLAGLLAGNFDRVQINTSERRVQPDRVRRFANAMGMRGAILQCRGDFPGRRAGRLADKSGGRGAAPPSWPEAREGAFCGYAGGLNPDNIGVGRSAGDRDKADEDGWTDVGTGVMPWPKLWAQCVAAGAEIMVAEHDNPSDFARFARVSADSMRRFAAGARS